MTLLGWSVPEGTDERFTLQQAATVFSFDRVNKAGAKFDWDKLNWLNSQVLHDLPKDQLLHELKPLWSKAGWALPEENWCLDLAELLGPSLTLLKDGVDHARPFFEEPTLPADGLDHLAVDGAKAGLSNLLDQLDSTSWVGFDVKQAQQLLPTAAQAANVKKGVIMKSLRAALLGRLQGPDLITTWGLLARIGQDLNRLRRCL